MVLEDENILEAPIFLEVQDSIAKGPENVLNPFGRQSRKTGGVVGRLDNDFVGPDSVHAVKHSLRLAIQIALDPQSRELVGHNTNGPSRGVPLRRGPSVRVRTVCLNLGRCLALVSVAKRAKSALNLHILANKIGWALRTIRRNNHPAPYDRIFSKFRHLLNPFTAIANETLIYAAREAFRNTSICGGDVRCS